MDHRELLEHKKEAEQRAADKKAIEKKREQQQLLEKQAKAKRDAAAFAHFQAVAGAVQEVCQEHPDRELDINFELFSDKEREAFEMLLSAKRGEDTTSIHLSAKVRMQLLNKALAVLYPTLALGKAPEYHIGLKNFLEAQQKIGDVRDEIKSDAGVEAIFFKVAGTAKKEEEEEEEDEEDEDGDDDDDKDKAADAADDDKPAKKKKKKGGLGRLFRRNKKPDDE